MTRRVSRAASIAVIFGLVVTAAPSASARALAPESGGTSSASAVEAAQTTATDDDPAPASAPADAVPARASLAVDTSALGPQSPVLLRRIEELGDIALRRAEILPGRSTDDPVIALRVRPLDEGGYAVESRLEVAATPVANSERTVLCTLCTEGETVERARAEVERLIPFVRGHAEARSRAAESARERPPPPAPVAPPPRAGLPTKTKIGAALTAVGVASLGVGIGLAARPAQPLPDNPLQVRDTRIPGFVLAGVGGALVISGVGLLLAGRSDHNERRIQVAPAGAGLLVSGRF